MSLRPSWSPDSRRVAFVAYESRQLLIVFDASSHVTGARRK